jgi:hypothetical protein
MEENNVEANEEITEQESFDFISEEEAQKRSIRTKLPQEVYDRYVAVLSQVDEVKWCHYKTGQAVSAKKNLLRVATQLSIPLIIQKATGGWVFRKATQDEVNRRKKRGGGRPAVSKKSR